MSLVSDVFSLPVNTFWILWNLLLFFTFCQVCLLVKRTAEIKTEIAEKSSWDQANIQQKLDLVWRNRKQISQIIKDYFYLPFFLLIILWLVLTCASPNSFLGLLAGLRGPGFRSTSFASSSHLPTPQSNQLTRGPPWFSSALSSHRSKSAACPKFDMFGYIARLSQWGYEGGNFLVQIISTCLGSHVERGGVSILWLTHMCSMYIVQCKLYNVYTPTKGIFSRYERSCLTCYTRLPSPCCVAKSLPGYSSVFAGCVLWSTS